MMYIGMGLLAIHVVKPHDRSESEYSVRHPGPGKGRQVCRRDEGFAGDVQDVINDDNYYADRKSAHSSGPF